ncbi:hypothetical protein PVAP13_9NG375800 [Panicum virgatum]|uniref:Uncharacterized protein n=1 Tax=Panicum virgatum TaxID=38727 RepID=A0A8T0MNI2_PANVG|nr:hypothetical protein PVAP13_9NG375800 [Panicum virgatum]
MARNPHGHAFFPSFYSSLPFTNPLQELGPSRRHNGVGEPAICTAARELLVASTARQRKDIAARARAQKLGTSSMVMAAHGRKAATAAQERGRPPVEEKFSGRSLAGNPSFGAPPPPRSTGGCMFPANPRSNGGMSPAAPT